MKVTVTYKNAFIRRLVKVVAVGLVFLAGLVIGSQGAHDADAKQCHRVAYTQDDYKADVAKFGQKVADYNDGFATATTECPR